MKTKYKLPIIVPIIPTTILLVTNGLVFPAFFSFTPRYIAMIESGIGKVNIPIIENKKATLTLLLTSGSMMDGFLYPY